MKRFVFSLFMVFFVLVFALHSAYAEMRNMRGDFHHDERRMPPPMKEDFLWMNLRGVGLDARQNEEVKGIHSRFIKETIMKKADIHVAYVELKDMLDKDTVNMKAVEVKLRQIEAMKTDLHLSQIKAKEEVKSKLTQEQRNKLKEAPGLNPFMKRMMDGGMKMPPPHF